MFEVALQEAEQAIALPCFDGVLPRYAQFVHQNSGIQVRESFFKPKISVGHLRVQNGPTPFPTHL